LLIGHNKLKKRDLSADMSYGWVRSEILGGLTNGCFLLAICLYVVLESIPKFIEPQAIEAGFVFIIVAAVGLGVNTIGTIIFCLTGQGHSHSHGGGGHDHGHDHAHEHKEKKKKAHNSLEEEEMKEKKEKGEGHVENKEKKEKKEGHSHSHDHADKKKKEKKEGHGHSHEHGDKQDKKQKKEKKVKKKVKKDLNVHAVFLHYLGDAVSSLMVLISGFFIHFFSDQKWTEYVDPVSSLLIVGLILWTTIPLVRRCAMILLQSTPTEIDLNKIRSSLYQVEGIVSVHDLHVWQLVDGMIIASVHIAVEEGADFNNLVSEVKRIFHEVGIHSSAIQPEFVPRNFEDAQFCKIHCVKDCDEDWCCKKTADKHKADTEMFSLSVEV